MPYATLAIDEIVSRPVFVVECPPDAVITIDRDWIGNFQIADSLLHIGAFFLKRKLRGVNTNDHKAGILVLRGPALDIRQSTQTVNTGIGPEVDEDDLSAERLCAERRRIQPSNRSAQIGE